MAASRWQERAGGDLFHGRLAAGEAGASLSVARSPTSAAGRQCCLRERQCLSRKVVLPEPGLDTRLTTNTPASWNCDVGAEPLRRCVSAHSDGLLRSGAWFIELIPLPRLAALGHAGFRIRARRTRAGEPLHGWDGTFRLAIEAICHERNFFDD